jgi:hypothetical protein
MNNLGSFRELEKVCLFVKKVSAELGQCNSKCRLRCRFSSPPQRCWMRLPRTRLRSLCFKQLWRWVQSKLQTERTGQGYAAVTNSFKSQRLGDKDYRHAYTTCPLSANWAFLLVTQGHLCLEHEWSPG